MRRNKRMGMKCDEVRMKNNNNNNNETKQRMGMNDKSRMGGEKTQKTGLRHKSGIGIGLG